MPAVVDTDLYPMLCELVADKNKAEGLLFALASELRYVPVEERTRELHVRALELKRDVAEWLRRRPDASVRQALCREVQELQAETRSLLLRPDRRIERGSGPEA